VICTALGKTILHFGHSFPLHYSFLPNFLSIPQVYKQLLLTFIRLLVVINGLQRAKGQTRFIAEGKSFQSFGLGASGGTSARGILQFFERMAIRLNGGADKGQRLRRIGIVQMDSPHTNGHYFSDCRLAICSCTFRKRNFIPVFPPTFSRGHCAVSQVCAKQVFVWLIAAIPYFAFQKHKKAQIYKFLTDF